MLAQVPEDRAQEPPSISSCCAGAAAPNQSAEDKLQHLWQGLLDKRERESNAMEVAENKKRQKQLLLQAGEDNGSSSAPNTEEGSSDLTMEVAKPQEKPREWPSYDAVVSSILAADYTQILKCPIDHVKRDDGGKTLCPHGVVCQAKLELFPAPPQETGTAPYTGILKPGTTHTHCLLRLSSAMQPPKQAIQSSWARSVLYTTGEKIRNAQLFPGAALKVFTDDRGDSTSPSRNVLFAGSKVGQRETDFFAHCQCTAMTERMPSVVKPFVRKFWQYSKWPLSLGISDFCKPLQEETEEEEEEINFPFALVLKPRIRSEPASTDEESEDTDADSDDEDNSNSGGGKGKSRRGWLGSRNWSFGSQASNTTATSATTESNNATEKNPFDAFVDFSLNQIPEDTHLFDLYACPTPYDVSDPSKMQRIGRVVTTSAFLESTPDDGLFFKHQAKEEDYELRPDWPEALSQKVTVENGKVKGTVGTLAGWKLFQELMDEGKYVDFENP